MPKRRPGLFRRDPSDREHAVWFRTLAALQMSHVPLPEALEECIEITSSQSLRTTLMRVRDRLVAGESFSDALDAETAVPVMAVALIRTAESTGTMAEALNEAADILELRQENAQTLASALTYPALILGISMAAAAFLAITVVPQLETMYRQAGRELTLLTRFMATAGTITGSIIAVSVLIAGLSIAAGIRQPAGTIRIRLQAWIDRLPILGTVRQCHATSLWTHCLAILLKHGIPLADALDLTSRTAFNPVTAAELAEARAAILSGQSPAKAFRSMKSTPPLAVRLLAGGDAAGDLAGAADRVHLLYSTEYRRNVRRLLVLAEPLAIVVAGLFVILIALSVLLPVAELGGIV